MDGFDQWANGRYDRIKEGWIVKDARINKGRIYTTEELQALYCDEMRNEALTPSYPLSYSHITPIYERF